MSTPASHHGHGPPDRESSGGPWAIRFTARRWRLAVIPARTGVPRLIEATLRGPWLEVEDASRLWRWQRGTAEITCASPRRAPWTRALPARMLLVSPCARSLPGEPDGATDTPHVRTVVFDCAGLPTTDFAQLSRLVQLFTESALLRDAALPPNLEDSRIWERLSSLSPRKAS